MSYLRTLLLGAFLSAAVLAAVPWLVVSARWTGKHSFEAGEYAFSATADDGVRVWVDGNLVIDQWRDQAATTYEATRAMTAGEHEVKVEYYEAGGAAVAKASWVRNTKKPPRR